MMLLIVMGLNREKKTLLFADTLEVIITEARRKLQLPEKQHRIVLEANGALVDEDPIIPHLPVSTELMIFSDDEQWVSKEETRAGRLEFVSTSGNKEHNQEENCPQRILSVNQSSHRSEALPPTSTSVSGRRAPIYFPWEKLPDTMTEMLNSNERLSDEQKNDLKKILGLHMTGTLKDYKRTTVAVLVKLLTEKYLDSLMVTDADGDRLSDGTKAYIATVYDHVNYKKPASEKTPRKRRQPLDETADVAVSFSIVEHDEYGCVAYQVPLPQGETKQSQESKRQELIEMMGSDDDFRIRNLMNETYATQRKDLIDRKGSTKEFLLIWPHFEDAQHFLAHASVLLGKDVKKFWDEKISSKGPALFSVFKKEQQKANPVREQRKVTRAQMKEVFQIAKTSAENLWSNTPRLLSLVQLLLLYFLEESNSMFSLLSDTSSVDEARQISANSDRPILIVKGTSLFDEAATGTVFSEGEEIVRPRNILECFLCFFLSYYVYGYTYGVNSKSLEFIQRVFQKINPSSGHKRGKKAKRILLTVNAQVQGLMEKVKEMEEN